jgi:transcriptional regulator with XRE-family HTH domain
LVKIKIPNIEGGYMKTKEAVAMRILELCQEKKIAVNTLANISGVSPSTVYSMLNEKSKNPGVVTIKKLCDGLGITLREFFESEIFEDLEQEIK